MEDSAESEKEWQLPPSRMPAAFDEDCFKFSKLYKCVHAEGQRVLNDIISAICDSEYVGRDCKTVKDYCKKRLNWSELDIKNKIDKMGQAQMTLEFGEEAFDLSFAYKIITVVLKHVYDKLRKHCQEQLERLKKMRNKVSHVYGYMPSDFETSVEDLKVLYKDIYKEVGKDLGVDFSENIKNIEDRLTKIVNAKVRQDDKKTYAEIHEGWWNESTNKMIVEGRSEQISYYQNLQVLIPCIWVDDEEYKNFEQGKELKFSIANMFTTPQLKLEGSEEVELQNLFKITKPATNIKPDVLILSGSLGSGKTSLLHYLIHVWCNRKKEVDELRDFDLVFLIEMRKVECDRLIDFLQKCPVFMKTSKNFKSEDIIPLIKSLDVLIIVDGFEESDTLGIQLLEDIFAKLGDQRIIMTTTPEFKSDAKMKTQIYHRSSTVIDIFAYDVRQQRAFATKVFGILEDDEEKGKKQSNKFLSKLRKCDHREMFQEHLGYAVNLSMLIYFWREDPSILDEATSSTRFFTRLFRNCQTKLAKSQNCTAESLDELLLMLGQLAWEKLKEEDDGINSVINKNAFSMLEDLCRDKNVNVTEFMSAFLMCSVDVNRNSEERIFEFLHVSQMRYLAARFLVENIITKKMIVEDIERDCDCKNNMELLLYIVGHFSIINELEKGYITDLMNLMKIPADTYSSKWKLFAEADCNEEVAKLLSLPTDDWQLSESEIVPALRILGYSQITLKSLRIEIPVDKEPHRIPKFLDTMKALGRKLGKRHNRENPILVQLHLWRHYEHMCDTPSDEFVQALYPWGHLTSFVGSVGEAKPGKEALAYCFRLKSLRVQVSTPGALLSLSNSLNRFYKSVREVCIALYIPDNFSAADYPRLKSLKNLELCVKDWKNEKLKLLALAVQHIGGQDGFRKLSLLQSELDIKNIKALLGILKKCVHKEIYVQTSHKPGAKEKLLAQNLEEASNVIVSWM